VEAIDTLAVLSDNLRRRIYFFVRESEGAASRQEVAKELGISVKLAAFHLDKLVDAGLLKAHYARPPERSGPGAGRSAKYYDPADIELEVSVPERHYDLAGELLLQALRSRSSDEPAVEAANRVALERGTTLGEEIRQGLRGGRIGPERAMAVAEEVLSEHGYEPYRPSPTEIRMRNCPFHRLARYDTDLVCGMNHAFISGFIRSLGNESIGVALEPSPDECCVTLREQKQSRTGSEKGE
jgi:predicted ArsR family transcriptional regulator